MSLSAVARVRAPPTRRFGSSWYDHEMVLHGLTAMLSHFDAEVQILTTATNPAEAWRRWPPPRRTGRCVTYGSQGQRHRPVPVRPQPCIRARVVLLTVYDDEHDLFQALRVGANGYLLNESLPNWSRTCTAR